MAKVHSWRPYSPQRDNERLRAWALAHGVIDPVPLLPKVGIVVDDVLALFLYRTDSTVCVLDSLIGDPLASREEIKAALPFAVVSLLRAARKLGFKRAIGLADRTSMLDLCRLVGGVVRPEITVLDASL